MKKFVAILAAVLMAILAIVPMASAAKVSTTVLDQSYTMYASSSNGKGVRMRSTPDASSVGNVYFSLGEGRPVTVTAVRNDGWSEVKVQVKGKWYTGYCRSEFLSDVNPLNLKQSFKAIASPFDVTVRTASVNGVVSMWDTTSKRDEHKLRDLDSDETLTAVAESRAWYKVMDAEGNEGYVAKAYVAKV